MIMPHAAALSKSDFGSMHDILRAALLRLDAFPAPSYSGRLCYACLQLRRPPAAKLPNEGSQNRVMTLSHGQLRVINRLLLRICRDRFFPIWIPGSLPVTPARALDWELQNSVRTATELIRAKFSYC